jgi:hypothetical protein
MIAWKLMCNFSFQILLNPQGKDYNNIWTGKYLWLKKDLDFSLLPALALFISCNTIIETDGAKAFRYIYQGTTYYESLECDSRGDSIGTISSTELIVLKEYFSEIWKG